MIINIKNTRITIMITVFALLSISIDSIANANDTVDSLNLLGETGFATGTQYQGTEIGGLSGIVYNAASGTFTALSDARGYNGTPRWYDLKIDLSDGSLDNGDVVFTGVTEFTQNDGGSFIPGDLDPEGIANVPGGGFYIASEGDLNGNPWIRQYSSSGSYVSSLTVAPRYFNDPGMTQGIRDNLAFESLNVTPDKTKLFAAVENSLIQDGPPATYLTASPTRIARYDLTGSTPTVDAEFVYLTDMVFDAPVPAGSLHTNGLVDLLAIDNDTLLTLERSFSFGVGNRIKLYEIELDGATDVSGIDALTGTESYVSKTLIADLGIDYPIFPDNIEGMALGPNLPNGNRSLIMVSDNNFNPNGQFTQFLAFEVNTVPEPATIILMIASSTAFLKRLHR